jgi:hypothetical protein
MGQKYTKPMAVFAVRFRLYEWKENPPLKMISSKNKIGGSHETLEFAGWLIEKNENTGSKLYESSVPSLPQVLKHSFQTNPRFNPLISFA